MSEVLTTMIVDAATGEEVIRPLTAEELADVQAVATEAAQREAEAQAKVDARQSALAKLAALGLTEEEVGAL